MRMNSEIITPNLKADNKYNIINGVREHLQPKGINIAVKWW